MKLFFLAIIAFFAFISALFMARWGNNLGKKRAYLMVLCSVIFFSAIFAGAESFFNMLENTWPSGPYVAEITSDVSLFTLTMAGTGELTLNVKNRGSLLLDSAAESEPVFLSWHLLDEKGGMIRFENMRIPFTSPVSHGDSTTVTVFISPASERIPVGRYILEFDLVCENVTWFADQGSAVCRIPMEVLP